MKTAGVVLDFYDDLTGRLLKQECPTPDDLPELVKQADTFHLLTQEEREVLRDDAFALVMANEGKVLRKFACVDPGNTLLSVMYFVENAHLLPEEAIKTAAVNLQAACKRYGFEHPFVKAAAELAEQEKDAGSRGKKGSAASRVRDSMQQPIVGDEADWAARTNLVSVRGGADSGRVIPAAQQMKTAGIVDVTGKEPVSIFEKKASERTVLGKYPLDSYADVRAAVGYFKDHWTDFDPVERHVFCVKTAARAEEIGLDVPDLMLRYGSQEYAPDVEAHLSNRKAVSDPKFHEVFDDMKEKRAEIDPETFADLLMRADVAAGLNWHWGGEIADPYYATFGGRAEQEKVAFSWEDGETAVDGGMLEEVAGTGALKGYFDDEVVRAFEKDPVTIFSSLPADAKKIIAQIAGA